MTVLPQDNAAFRRALLENNSGISEAVVTASERIEEQLRRLGVDLRPHYSLTPALGNILGSATCPYPPQRPPRNISTDHPE